MPSRPKRQTTLCFSEPDGAPIVYTKDFYRDLEQEYQGLYV
jgi:hypothetical protein